MILDRQLVISADDSDFEYVDVPEWTPKGSAEVAQVRVKSLSGDQRARFWARIDQDKKGPVSGNAYALACAMGMVDDKGAYLFPNENEGALLLGKKHPEVIERIAGKILDMSAMTKASREALEKKSQEMTNSSGGTSSPEPSTPAME
jgi:hypothetical protein